MLKKWEGVVHKVYLFNDDVLTSNKLKLDILLTALNQSVFSASSMKSCDFFLPTACFVR